MAVRRITVHCVEIEDKPGSLQKFLTQSSLSGVDFLCFAAFSCGNNCGRVFVGAKEAAKFEAFAKEAELGAQTATGFIVSGEDRVGAAAETLKGLAENNIDGIASSAMVIDGQYQMLVVVDTVDAERAEAFLSQ